MKRSPRFLLTSISFAFLASCSAVGPDYKRPDIEMPSAFRHPAFQAPVEHAVHHNQDIRIAVAAVHEARAARRIAGSRWMPSIDAIANYRRLRASETGVIDFGTLSDAGLADVETDLHQTGLEASLEIDVFGSVRRDNEAAIARVQEVDERLADAERRALEVDLELVRSEAEVTRRAIRLYRSLGGGWEHSIRTIETAIAAN